MILPQLIPDFHEFPSLLSVLYLSFTFEFTKHTIYNIQ